VSFSAALPPLSSSAAQIGLTRGTYCTDAGPSTAELLLFVRAAAADPDLVASLSLHPRRRTWISLPGPAGSEAWLIGWPPGTSTDWHDHGRSRGAFATAAGVLTEESLTLRLPTDGWTALELAEGTDRQRELARGAARAFGEHHVHDVRNESGTSPAISVHAYYPPLQMMRRYNRTGMILRPERMETAEKWA
jgi:hypothetical protein